MVFLHLAGDLVDGRLELACYFFSSFILLSLTLTALLLQLVGMTSIEPHIHFTANTIDDTY